MKQTLVYRSYGGIGDILLHRLLFQSVFEKYGNCWFCCPVEFWPLLLNHPFLSGLISPDELNKEKWNFLNTSNIDRDFERFITPKASRLDVWARAISVKLPENPCSYLTSDKKPDVGSNYAIISPISAATWKDLQPFQILPVVNHLKKKGLTVFGLHSSPVDWLTAAGVEMMASGSLADWLGVISGASVVVSADSASFHAAGCFGVPVVGVFGAHSGADVARYYPSAAVVQSSLACSPCGSPVTCPFADLVKPCIDLIGPERIVAAVESLAV